LQYINGFRFCGVKVFNECVQHVYGRRFLGLNGCGVRMVTLRLFELVCGRGFLGLKVLNGCNGDWHSLATLGDSVKQWLHATSTSIT